MYDLFYLKQRFKFMCVGDNFYTRGVYPAYKMLYAGLIKNQSF